MTSSALRISAVAIAAAAALAVPGLAAAGGSVSIGVGVYGPGYYGGYYGGPRPYYGGPRPYYGGGWYGPRWYGPGPYYYGPPAVYAYPYPYPPAVTVVPAQPPVYIERDPGTYSQVPAPQAQQPLESGFWYYCRNPAGYYPNVGECPGGWEKVPPRPPGAQ
jgi:hypothetical protein